MFQLSMRGILEPKCDGYQCQYEIKVDIYPPEYIGNIKHFRWELISHTNIKHFIWELILHTKNII